MQYHEVIKKKLKQIDGINLEVSLRYIARTTADLQQLSYSPKFIS